MIGFSCGECKMNLEKPELDSTEQAKIDIDEALRERMVTSLKDLHIHSE